MNPAMETQGAADPTLLFAPAAFLLLASHTSAEPCEGRGWTPCHLPSRHLAGSLLLRDCPVYMPHLRMREVGPRREHSATGGAGHCRLIKTTLASILVLFINKLT